MKENLETIKHHLAVVKNIRQKAKLRCEKADQVMVKKNLSSNPPSKYKIGDKVLVRVTKNKKSNKVKGKGVSFPTSYEGTVKATNPGIQKYKVQHEISGQIQEEWVSVSLLSSITRADENAREKSCKFSVFLLYLI